MDVIIVSKTRMKNAVCVGGVLADGRFVRLLNENGSNQDKNTTLKIGDVYTIDFLEQSLKRPPHIEDILLTNMTFNFSIDSLSHIAKYLKEKLDVKIWNGSIDVLFDGMLQWTNGGSGYISENTEIPVNSVGFWIPDRDLTKRISYKKTRYNYIHNDGWRSLPYVGYSDPISVIPAGTLVRVSLARWWNRRGETENRCSLQLSGWYDLP